MEDVFSFNTENVLWKIVYTDKRVSKAQIKAVDVDGIIRSADGADLGLRKLSILILALSKIISKRMKFLHEDCTHILHVVCRDEHTAVRSLRVPSSKLITLGIENENLYINDEMIDMDDEFIIPAGEDSLLDAGLLDDNFEADFAGLSNVEQARDGTLVDSSNILAENSLVAKRRRVFEDAITEYSLDIFRANMRSTADIIDKSRRDVRTEGLESSLRIDSKIFGLLKIEDKAVSDDIENERQSLLADNFMDNEFSFNAQDDRAFGDEEICMAEQAHIFKAENLPMRFQFGHIVEGYGRHERALCFNDMLTMASNGEIEVAQELPYGSIDCRVISS